MTIKAIDEASDVMGKVSAAMGLIGSTLETLGPGFSNLGQVIQGFAVGGPTGAAIVGLGEIVKGMQDSVGAAATLQSAWVGVQSVMQLTGAAWDTMKGKIDAVVESLRTTTTFSDTQLIGAFQQLVTYGMTASQAMDALGAAAELAAAKHIDLTTAATALGKAFGGNDMLLVRYGVDVSTVSKLVSLGTEAIKEMGVNLESAGTTQLSAFSAAVTAAGLSLTDANGKLLTHAAILKEITDAWKSGSIDADQLSTIVGALGITFQGSKALAMDYSNVLTQVNTQYGGAAQAQATTYAGLQERLSNAFQEVSEKIGTMVLPALTSLMTGLLPIVDGFSKAVDAVESWVTAIGKIPAVQGAVSAFQGVWDGLTKSFDDAWNKVQGDFMPALKDLQDAFNQLAAALQPVWDALNELWHAITGGTGDFNLFQAVLEAIVTVIKGLADGIRLVTPVIALFAQGFKDLADIIGPAITWIMTTLGAFWKWLTDGFQAFYDWLVGHSLWQDLWNAVLSILDTAITGLVGKVTTGIFDWLKNGFTTVVSDIQGAWGGVVAAITTPLDQVASAIQTKFPALAAAITAGTDIMKGNWVTELGEMASAVPGVFGEIGSAISTALEGAATSLGKGIMDVLAGADKSIKDWYSSLSAGDPMKALVDAVVGGVSELTGAVSGIPSALAPAAAAVSTSLAGVGTSAATALSSAGDTVSTATSAIASTLTTAATNWTTPIANWVHWLVGGSIWPETWTQVQTITTTNTTAITTLLQASMQTWTSIFTDGVKGLADIWNAGLQTLIAAATAGITVLTAAFTTFYTTLDLGRTEWTAFTTAATVALANLKAAVPVFLTWLTTTWTTTFDTLTATFTVQLTQIQDAVAAASSAMGAVWQSTMSGMLATANASLASLNAVVASFLSALASAWTTFSSQISAMENLVKSGGSTMQISWQATMSGMVSTTQAALQLIYNNMNTQVNAIIARLQAAKQAISSGSIWPDMLAEMVAQTHAGMAAIQGEFASGFESSSGIIPTIQAGGSAMTAAAPSAAPAAGSGSQAITLPVNVYLDGQQIQTFLEKRIVDTLIQHAGRSKRV
jgi:hypothetical protein